MVRVKFSKQFEPFFWPPAGPITVHLTAAGSFFEQFSESEARAKL